MSEEEFSELLKALNTKALGNTIEVATETWERDKETGKEILTGRVVKKTTFDIDTQACIKLIDIEMKRREQEKEFNPYEKLTDEQLEAEKQRLLKELWEEEKKVKQTKKK